MSKVIIDADVVAYMSASAAVNDEEVDVWGEGVAQSQSHNATTRAINMVESWAELADTSVIRLAFSGPSDKNFRRRVHPLYKAQRATEKPEGYSDVVNVLKDRYDWRQYPSLEGDDILGMHMGQGWTAVSTDKDMQTVPGKFIRVRTTGDVDRFDSSEYTANRFWMWQTLVGDPVDNYKGCPGCGRKGADVLLNNIYSKNGYIMWDNVVRRYEQAWNKPASQKKFVTGHPYDEALMNARAARILRDGEYNYDFDEVELWTP